MRWVRNKQNGTYTSDDSRFRIYNVDGKKGWLLEDTRFARKYSGSTLKSMQAKAEEVFSKSDKEIGISVDERFVVNSVNTGNLVPVQGIIIK